MVYKKGWQHFLTQVNLHCGCNTHYQSSTNKALFEWMVPVEWVVAVAAYIYKTPDEWRDMTMSFVLNLKNNRKLRVETLQLVMQSPCCFQIGHVVQIKLETGVNFRFVSLLP